VLSGVFGLHGQIYSEAKHQHWTESKFTGTYCSLLIINIPTGDVAFLP